MVDLPGIWRLTQCHTLSPTLGVSVTSSICAIRGLVGVGSGLVSEFLGLGLPGLVPGLGAVYVGAVYTVAVGASSSNVFVNHSWGVL